MIRTWIGVAMLASSWTIGLGYYRPASWWFWALTIVLGTLLLDVRTVRLPSRRERLVAGVGLLPVLVLVPWPWAIAVTLLVLGLLLGLTPIPRAWPERLGTKALVAGAVLTAQAGAMAAYAHAMARSHDLPGAATWLLGQIARLTGADVAVHQETLALRAGDRVERLAATWDLLVDPATLLFLVGGLVALALMLGVQPTERWRSWLRRAGALLGAVAVWLPIRAAFMLGAYAQRALRAEPDVASAAMGVFLSWWVALLLLAGPVLLAAWWVRRPRAPEDPSPDEAVTPELIPLRRQAIACAMVLLGAGVVVFFGIWEPVGQPKGGRVMVVERHSKWEPTTNEYDEDHYGEPNSYTYRIIYDYAGRRFAMSRLMPDKPINAETLAQCDVLIVKIPTARFSPEEVGAIKWFVQHGGGLLLIGDHTNVFRSTTYLNDIARQFGFAFRNDLLFRVGTPFQQHFAPPSVPHPSVAHLDGVNFAVSCSIDPGTSLGWAAIQAPGLWSIQAQYENSNYHPPAEYRPEMRYGPFIQLWAARCGTGRVMAFTDSTIFSNFCIFQPGKAELFVGMIDWLNHESPLDRESTRGLVVITSILTGLALLIVGTAVGRGRMNWAVLLAAGLLGATLGAATAAAMHRAAMPAVRPVNLQPDDKIDVVLDRTLSDVPLSLGAFTQGQGEGFGLLEQWIPRLGYFTSRAEGLDVFSGDALVVIQPTGSVTQAYRDKLLQFVEKGGRLVVFVSPENGRSTSGGLLWPFGLNVDRTSPVEGLVTDGQTPETDTATRPSVQACPVTGGRPIAWVGDVPVAAQATFGQGIVTVIGFASAFNDAQMGQSWATVPDTALRARFDLLYRLLRRAIEPKVDLP
ncbi:MAG: hypothetical protein JW818_19855 [Pirellulales bacterium]|nr:hypothetical protein [Pirellulales bacterium]